MMLGMSLTEFTVLHVAASLVGLAAGLVAAAGMMASRVVPAVTALFLSTTLIGNLTGLMFPSPRLALGHQLGIVSMLVLLPALAGLYLHHLAGAWRWIYTTSALTALWLNGVITLIQAFRKLAVLQPYADRATVQGAQAALFVAFAVLAILAARHFRPCRTLPTSGLGNARPV